MNHHARTRRRLIWTRLFARLAANAARHGAFATRTSCFLRQVDSTAITWDAAGVYQPAVRVLHAQRADARCTSHRRRNGTCDFTRTQVSAFVRGQHCTRVPRTQYLLRFISDLATWRGNTRRYGTANSSRACVTHVVCPLSLFAQGGRHNVWWRWLRHTQTLCPLDGRDTCEQHSLYLSSASAPGHFLTGMAGGGGMHAHLPRVQVSVWYRQRPQSFYTVSSCTSR